jgi:GxxExxY protein
VKYEHVIVGDFVADLVVAEALICELKAAVALSEADEVQLVNNLTATNHDLGLLLNFGSESLQFKRKHRRKLSNVEDVDFRNPVNPKNPVNPV